MAAERAVLGAGCGSQWFLRLGEASGEPAAAASGAAGGSDAGDPWPEAQAELRESADAAGARGAGTSGEREHGGATDEAERFASDDGPKVPAHDRLESSAAGGPQRVGSTIRGEWSQREMGLGYHVRVDRGRLVVPGGGGGFVLAEGGGLVAGRAADERVGERGLADGDRPAAADGGFWRIRTVAANMPAGVINGCWRRVGSRAA